jgi:hypothetical protein
LRKNVEDIHADEPDPADEHRRRADQKGRKTFRNRLLSQQSGVMEESSVSRANKKIVAQFD